MCSSALGLGPREVREVHEQMCPDGELAFNTVQTVLRIMEDKGLIRHRAGAHVYLRADLQPGPGDGPALGPGV